MTCNSGCSQILQEDGGENYMKVLRRLGILVLFFGFGGYYWMGLQQQQSPIHQQQLEFQQQIPHQDLYLHLPNQQEDPVSEIIVAPETAETTLKYMDSMQNFQIQNNQNNDAELNLQIQDQLNMETMNHMNMNFGF